MGIKLEADDLSSIGEALREIMDKVTEQFEVREFDLLLRYGGHNDDDPGIDIRVTADSGRPFNFNIEMEQAPPKEPAKQ